MSDLDGRRRAPLRDVAAGLIAGALHQAERIPGFAVVREAVEREHRAAGGLLAGGVAFRVFLWLVPFGLVVAGLLSIWSTYDPDALESSAKRFGISAAAAHGAAEALDQSDRNIVVVLAFGLVMLGWFTLGAVRALVLAHTLAWQLEPRRVRRPLRAVMAFNGLFVLVVGSSAGVAWLREEVAGPWVIGWVLGLGVMTCVVAVAMWALPHRASHVRDLAPGAALVTAGYQLVYVAVLVYFAPRLGRAEETYGAFGAAATMLIWLYVLSRLVTIAAFLNATVLERREAGVSGADDPDAPAPA